MGVFTRFGGSINQNIQQPLKAKSSKKPHENVKSSSVSEEDSNIIEPWYWDPDIDPKLKAEYKKHSPVRSMPLYVTDPKYYDLDELKRQTRLWIVPNDHNKHPWYDAPATVKVKTKKGVCHLKIEFTLGWPPHGVYEMLTNPRNLNFFDLFDREFRQRLDNESTKVLKKDGPRQVTDVKKTLRWKVLGCTIAIPIHLIIDENHKNLTANYKKEKMKCMKVFEGSWKVKPLYADQERLCKSKSRINDEEYKRCSNGKGRIGSKVTMEHIFQPCSLLNVPPISWFIRKITIRTVKDLLEDLRQYIIDMHKSYSPG
ncbi:hypothetical protein CARUB_v10025431mg [Capsella rubella]|uniref:DUF220 domain-containing protein n=1 Tax=Capsella rubella TaxID=81985 RepID=R0HHL3_9BRAS|nr:uncharacterized protein LOC17889361 [Capsella rubella]EOA29164.1 hypothetical protein CARUB_v10025431mg [Capsella rubella]